MHPEYWRKPRPRTASAGCSKASRPFPSKMKDAYYFSHDSNARNDAKLIPVRMKYGMRGYGIFFGIVEMLRETNTYQLPKNWEAIAYDLRENASDIEDIVLNYQLFTVNGATFWSGSLKTRMKKREEVSKSRSLAGKIGGLANAEKTKGRPRPYKYTPEFEALWIEYPSPIGKKTALKYFKSSVKTDIDVKDIWKALNNYKGSKKVAEGFIQNGSTWMNNWRDWVYMDTAKFREEGEEWKTPNLTRR